MSTILNFKSVELVAATKEEAIEMMQEKYYHYAGDATQAYKNWLTKQGTKVVTEKDKKEFMLEYLEKKTKSCPGSGFMITIESAVADTRERPWAIEDVKNEGKRDWKTMYIWRDNETGTEICRSDKNKADAKNMIRDAYKNGYKGNASLYKDKVVLNGKAVVATSKYTPSKNTKNGRFLVFGIEA